MKRLLAMLESTSGAAGVRVLDEKEVPAVAKHFHWSILCGSTLAMTAAVVACGGSDEHNATPAPDTGVATEGGPDTTVTETTPETSPPIDTAVDTAIDTPPDAVPVTVKAFTMTLTQTTSLAGGTATYASLATAVLVDTSLGKCTYLKGVACDVIDCDLTPTTGADGGIVKAVNASDVHFNSPTLGDIEIYPDSVYGLYNTATGTKKIFAAGDTITTTGGYSSGIPSWKDKPGTAPGDATVTAPPCAAGDCPDVDRTADLALAWSGVTSGDVNATYATVETGKKRVVVSCTFKGADGKGTIPSSALAKLGKADGTTITGAARIAPATVSPFKSGEYDVILFISGSGAEGKFKVGK